ncbi:MAG: hypothetical protein NW216_08820 [Hyphomicrobium sp.]|nr:hypothetical protein [Hyphomicrobium sp.]
MPPEPRLLKLSSSLGFLARQRLVGFAVPTEPHFESAETTAWFRSALETSGSYLEYGTGGSTVLAAASGVRFISVESDRLFLRNVERKIREAGFYDPAKQMYRHVDIGLTGKWGRPIGSGLTERRRDMFRRYSDIPADLHGQPFQPDLVLVDGRFRVASALKVLREFPGADAPLVAVDDYAGRAAYAVIADFGHLKRLVGRLAVFRGLRPDADLAALDAAIRVHETDPD